LKPPSGSPTQRKGQYRLVQFNEDSWIPTTSIAVQESLPTGRYDQLDDQPNGGFGSGACATTLALYTQRPFWLPNGRILRMRFNVSQTFSRHANVEGTSVYGTAAGFRGQAKPGSSSFVNASWEYSLTRRWVLALDATYRYSNNTRVTGRNISDVDSPDVQLNSGFSDAIGLAPAVEYSWNGNVGVLLGVRLIPAGRNTSATVTPALAINFVR
jgi:hypothetical protein